MSIFNELLPEINDISKNYLNNIQNELQKALEALEKFGDEYKASRGSRARETLKGKNHLKTLQSISEDDVEVTKNPVEPSTKTPVDPSTKTPSDPANKENVDGNVQKEKPRLSKKRSKDMVDDTKSPEQEKRVKRNASAKAQDVISKQVNINLSKKLRREGAPEEGKRESRSRTRRGKNDKEITMPLPILLKEIKLERVSVPEVVDQPMEQDPVPEDVVVKQEVKDDICMPPPMAPVPKTRKAKDRQEDKEVRDAPEDKTRRSTRSRKQTDTVPSQPVSSRSTRGSPVPSKSTEDKPPSPEARPKRTRAKKKQAEQPPEKEVETEKQTEKSDSDNATNSTSPKVQENARPKRTRKAPAKLQNMIAPERKTTKSNTTTPSEESQDEVAKSPILQQKEHLITNSIGNSPPQTEIERVDDATSAKETTIVAEVAASNLNETVILHNGKYDHVPETPQAINMNDTVILERCARSTLILHKQDVNETVVISKETSNNLTEDDSIMTEDNSDAIQTPTKTPPQQKTEIIKNPPSAVKEKVQQFEEIASRVTRTKTRAMAKKDDESETQTPPDKIGIPPKSVLSADTLNKMNNLIFNGKHVSASATKAIPVPVSTSKGPSSTTKVSAIAKMREREEELKREKEDARKKKEAMLEAKKEMQRRKREEKMAAAAAVRSAAEKERFAQFKLAEKERHEKLEHLKQGKIEKQKENERKKQELARKAAETEERRKAEEQARAQKLAEEQKKADEARRKQQEDAEAVKKEAARMAKEMEKRKREYMEKQNMKKKLESDKVTTPLRNPMNSSLCYQPASPVHMEDGFEYLNSDSDDEPKNTMPVPLWSQSKVRWKQLQVQGSVKQTHVDRLFSVRQHSVDLRALFPDIDKRALKRTSSAVWRSPRRPN